MEKGATLRLMGRSYEASEIFHRAMDEFASQNVPSLPLPPSLPPFISSLYLH
jgi:hypothetical protein